ncbi:MAG: recombinase family protein [Janthinobacterium lividum]
MGRPRTVSQTDEGTLPAAAYVRMSTDLQKYSTENQLDLIRQFADRRGFSIVRIYEDAGRSGLTVDGREGIQRLMSDVVAGRADFRAVLVYDISRWGRFQDADEGGYHEHVCRRAGIQVHYCAEQFDNDGSTGSALLKAVKRVMAGEYSRELSVKVFAGQCRLIEKGFRQGGMPGYGLRRLLLDEAGQRKGELGRGQRKSLQTERVILIPGPPEEVGNVRRMYERFLSGVAERDIAAGLNAEGLRTDLGRPWTRGTVHQVLTNPKYAGDNVFNRVSNKLKQRRVVNQPSMWVVARNAFEPVIPREVFERARAVIEDRSCHYDDAQLLALLADLHHAVGTLSGLVIDENEHMPSSSVYRRRFGSLLRAYRLVGYVPDRDYAYVETNRRLRAMHPEVIASLVAGLEAAGGSVTRDPANDLLGVNGEFTASVVIARHASTAAGASRWRIRLDSGLNPDVTVAIRMDAANVAPLDYYVLPSIDMTEPRLRLAEDNGFSLDAYRFDDLGFFFSLAERAPFQEAV